MKTAVDSSVLFDILKGSPGAQGAYTALQAALVHGSLRVHAAVFVIRNRETVWHPIFLIGDLSVKQADALRTTIPDFSGIILMGYKLSCRGAMAFTDARCDCYSANQG